MTQDEPQGKQKIEGEAKILPLRREDSRDTLLWKAHDLSSSPHKILAAIDAWNASLPSKMKQPCYYRRHREGNLLYIVHAKGSNGGTTRNLYPASMASLRTYLSASLRFVRQVSAKEAQSKHTAAETDKIPPDHLFRALMEKGCRWQAPVCTTIVRYPLVDINAPIESALLWNGYDAEAELFCDYDYEDYKDEWGKNGLTEADLTPQQIDKDYNTIDSVFDDFVFAEPVHRAAAVAVVISDAYTALEKACPLVLVTGADAHSGKSTFCQLLAELCSHGLSGTYGAGMTSKEEFEKTIDTAALEASRACVLDNFPRGKAINNDRLAFMVTAKELSIRLLGYSKRERVPGGFWFFCNGNGASLSEDCTRRGITIKLKKPPRARVEFLDECIGEAKKNRAKIRAAVVRLFLAARTMQPVKHEGKCVSRAYAVACRVVAMKAGQNPLTLIDEQKREDPAALRNGRILSALEGVFGERGFTMGEACAKARASQTYTDPLAENDLGLPPMTTTERETCTDLYLTLRETGYLDKKNTETSLGIWAAARSGTATPIPNEKDLEFCIVKDELQKRGQKYRIERIHESL